MITITPEHLDAALAAQKQDDYRHETHGLMAQALKTEIPEGCSVICGVSTANVMRDKQCVGNIRVANRVDRAKLVMTISDYLDGLEVRDRLPLSFEEQREYFEELEEEEDDDDPEHDRHWDIGSYIFHRMRE